MAPLVRNIWLLLTHVSFVAVKHSEHLLFECRIGGVQQQQLGVRRQQQGLAGRADKREALMQQLELGVWWRFMLNGAAVFA